MIGFFLSALARGFRRGLGTCEHPEVEITGDDGCLYPRAWQATVSYREGGA